MRRSVVSARNNTVSSASMTFAQLCERVGATEQKPSIHFKLAFKIPVQNLEKIRSLEPTEQYPIDEFALFRFVVTDGVAIIKGEIKVMPDGRNEIWNGAIMLQEPKKLRLSS